MSRTIANLKPLRPSRATASAREADEPSAPQRKISRMSIDMPESERLQLKRIALDKNTTLRELVLAAVREKYQLVRSE